MGGFDSLPAVRADTAAVLRPRRTSERAIMGVALCFDRESGATRNSRVPVLDF